MAKLKKWMTADEVEAYLDEKYGPLSPESQAVIDVHVAETAAQIHVMQLVREARAQSKLSQRELAQISGVSQPELSRFESGQSNPTLGTLVKICSALGYKLTLTQK